jgi:acetyl-CoA C-acetyltransferase
LRKVAIVSSSTSQFVKESKLDVFDLACKQSAEILKGEGVVRREIDALLFSSCTTQQYSSSIISEMVGLKPRISQRIDNLCNSGTNAIATGYSLIASEMCDLVLVVGSEKADSGGNKLLWDVTRGSFMFPVHWAALFAKAHMRKYGTTEEQLAMIAVKNRRNASKNPNALFREPVSLEQVMNSRKIADPVKLLDCSAPCDGASAVLLASERVAHRLTDKPVWIKGIGQRTNSASFANATSDLTTVESAKLAGRDAFEMANLHPKDIDIAEVHDAFTILELLALEDLGLKSREKTSLNNHVSVNQRGGILGCGHPVGTTGVAQVAEISAQLSGKAGENQVKHCKYGLVHNLAAAGSSATVMIMES